MGLLLLPKSNSLKSAFCIEHIIGLSYHSPPKMRHKKLPWFTKQYANLTYIIIASLRLYSCFLFDLACAMKICKIEGTH